ncbi:MAG: asparagine synthase-related protein [Acidimicrobiales bacterium]
MPFHDRDANAIGTSSAASAARTAGHSGSDSAVDRAPGDAHRANDARRDDPDRGRTGAGTAGTAGTPEQPGDAHPQAERRTPLPHEVDALAMADAAADRMDQPRRWADGGAAVVWGTDARYERPPIRVDTIDGTAWLEGRVGNDAAEVERILARVLVGDIAACVALRGAFSIWARSNRPSALRVVSDPFGRRPVYWTRTAPSAAHGPSGLAAATEIRQLMANPHVSVRLDEAVVAAMIGDVVFAADVTPFEGVWMLPPGHVLEAGVGAAAVHRWMSWPERVDHGPTQADWAEELRALCVQAVRRNLAGAGVALTGSEAATPATPAPRPTSRVGVTLSGGLDSSMLAAMAVEAAEAGTQAVTALTMRFPGHASDETRYQDLMLAHLGVAEVSVGPSPDIDYWEQIQAEVARRLVPAPWIQPEIVALLGRAAESGLSTVMRGVGGDELFAPGTATVIDALASRRFDALGQFFGDGPLRSRAGWAARGVRDLARQGVPAKPTRGLADWVAPSGDIRRRMDELAVHPPRGVGLSAAMRRDRWRRLETNVAREQADWTDASETASGLALVDPLVDVDLVAAANTVPEALRWAPGDPRRLQRGVAFPYLPDEVMRRPDKAYMGPAMFAHLDHRSVTAVLGDLEVARHGLVDAAGVAALAAETRAAYASGNRDLASGPPALAVMLLAEALLRQVSR